MTTVQCCILEAHVSFSSGLDPQRSDFAGCDRQPSADKTQSISSRLAHVGVPPSVAGIRVSYVFLFVAAN
jgi:hypothetical protein